ncbi:uncharacterized protein BX663DRAFT_491572 [Cokeromyces recurvatus]|uniref:uncharacterized protein n=1 Tax=Cokeromyces recurvatus TaxID=90255 RepID=UPI002220BBAC|nr:uncharacterized protein BX663DRAFT_491572 [Cokeromyces recurvatus]KAI7907651.1 hypothetical protein BX663DRAFT_491572 [Cokeromyces recurvatus]
MEHNEDIEMKNKGRMNKTINQKVTSNNEKKMDENIPKEEKKTKDSFKSTSIALIEKLLQFSTPRLDSKIVNVLFLEGMMDIFMTHITRLNVDGDEEEEIVKRKEIELLESCSIEEKLKLSKHKRDMEDVDALKRSYHAMEFLSGTTANHLWVQNAKFYEIVSHLVEVFLPSSNGNFNHFFKIFQHLVRRHPCDMLGYIIMDREASILFNYMLPYLTESPVMESLLSLIFVRDINPETREAREKSYERLYELGFLEFIINAMQLKEYPDYLEAAQEFFVRVIEEASQVDHGDILFRSLKEDKGKDIIESLVMQVTHNPPSNNRDRTINVIKLLVKSGILSTRISTVSSPVQGPLYFISLRTQELLAEHIPDICSLIVKDRESKNTKIASLTTSDMDLLDIIYQTLYNTNEKTQMLASIPVSFWKILVNSFFEKSTSNIYHTLFYRIICLILSINYEPTLVIIVRDQNLITRMIDTYQDKERKSENHGFILLILNQLRLMADAHHSELITCITSEHSQYQEFLPILRKDTLAQIEPIYKWKMDACPRPPSHIGPSPPIQAIHFSPYTGTIPLMSNEDSVNPGIDLGSDFAYCLGFKESGKEGGRETPYGYLSRTNSDYSSSHSITNDTGFPMDIIWGESLTAENDSDHLSSNNNQKKKDRIQA